MTKIAIIADTHWGVRGASQIFMRHMEKFFDDIFFPYLDKHGIKTIIHAGDVVDNRKSIEYVTLHRMRKAFIDRCIQNGIEMHVIVGNHDVPYRNTNDINANDELYPHNFFGDIGFINYKDPTTIEIGGTNILLLPWINSSNYEASVEEIQNTKADIAIGHLELSGFEMYRGVVNHHGSISASLFKNFDMVLSGHFHHKSTKGNITYVGSPYEMTWADYNDKRGFHILDTSDRSLEFVRNPYRMFHKIVYNDSEKTLETMKKDLESYRDTYVKVIVQEKNDDYTFDILMDELYKVGPANINIVEDHKNADEESNDDIIENVEDTINILNSYVEKMNIDADKKSLQKLFNELYSEAQTISL